MNARFLAAFLSLATLSGCIIHDNDNYDNDGNCCVTPPPQPAQPGDVTFLWKFAGLSCNDDRGIKGVNIQIPGEVLHNNGRYDCTTGNVDGITLHDFAPGTYSFTIEGVDYYDTVLYRGAGTFTINGDVTVQIDLSALERPAAYLSWSFPGNVSCAQAGITRVDVTIDHDHHKSFNCEDGTGYASVSSPPLAAGSHYIALSGYDSTGRRLYFFRGELLTQAGTTVDRHYALWETGGAALSWTLSDGSATRTCAQAGVQQVSIDLKHLNTGEWVFATLGDWLACEGPPAVYDFLRPGRYQVSMFARDASGGTYWAADNLYIDVVAGQYPPATQALNVLLVKPQQ